MINKGLIMNYDECTQGWFQIQQEEQQLAEAIQRALLSGNPASIRWGWLNMQSVQLSKQG